MPLLAVVAVVLVACGGSAVDRAPDFTINIFQGQEAVGGEQVALSQLLGTRPIVLNFWAGLCPPCRAEMPDLQKFHEEFSDRVLLLGIDLGQFTGLGSQEDAQDLLSELGVTYPAGSTNDASVIVDYRVLGMPSTVFIDGNGEIFTNWTGALNDKVLREKTLEMLNQ
jgi:cytochrome c biogenesis protein CcmG/thiol:disulfide interchange protein DsbE